MRTREVNLWPNYTQLVDDALDYESINPSPGSSSSGAAANGGVLGKPAGADLKLGLATAPALFAWEEYPDLMFPLIKRRFKGPGDVETVSVFLWISSVSLSFYSYIFYSQGS